MSETDDDAARTGVVEVTIFDQTYKLRSEADAEHLRRVARVVDGRMRAIASQMANHELFKIAVLTALNIADEMESLRARYESEIQPLISEYAAGREDEEPLTEEARPDSW